MKKNLFSTNIKYLLKERRLPKSYLSELTGMATSSVGYYVNGDKLPNIEFLLIVSEDFDVSCDDLLKKDLSKQQAATGSNKNSNSFATVDLDGVDDFHIMDYVVKNEDRLKEENSFFRVWIKEKVRDFLQDEIKK